MWVKAAAQAHRGRRHMFQLSHIPYMRKIRCCMSTAEALAATHQVQLLVQVAAVAPRFQ
jgi:hypothetical protein